MKKTIVLILSLILLFSFVSCNGSTNSPSDSGSSTKPSINLPTVPVDTNVPPSSDFIDAEEGGNTKLLSGINALNGIKPLVQKSEGKSTITYQIKKNESWMDGNSIEGELTIKIDGKYDNNEYKNIYNFNGEVIINDVEYTFENFVYNYEQKAGKEPLVNFSGTVKSKNSIIDNTKITSDYTDLYTLINSNNSIEPISIIKSAKLEGGSYIEFDSSTVKGKFSSSRGATANSRIYEGVANFEKIKIDDASHKMTASYKLTEYFDGKQDFEITYISFDTEYYQTKTINDEVINNLKYLVKL